MKLKNTDMLNGSLTKALFSLAFPFIIGTLLQNAFNLADKIVLGQMAGEVAVASIGICTPITGLIVSFLTGISTGASVILARALGAGQKDHARRIISTCTISAVALGSVFLAVALITDGPLLRLIDCPEQNFADAKAYMLWYYLGLPAMALYNFSAASLRVDGDSKRPTIYLTCAGVLNIVLNVVLCLAMEQKVVAVAIATTASQTLSAILSFLRLLKIDEAYRFDFKNLFFEWKIFEKVIRYGAPNGLANASYNVANLLIQSAINTYGSAAIAGFSTEQSLNALPVAFGGGFHSAELTLMGQNIGAKQPKRVRNTILLTYLYSMAFNGIFGLLLYAFRKPLIELCVPNSPDTITYTTYAMLAIACFDFIVGFNGTTSNGLNAFGLSLYVLFEHLFTVVVFRFIWMTWIYPINPTFPMLMACFTVSWILQATISGTVFFFTYRRYRKTGKTR